ncbi:MAG: Holliday junction resolvase RuvX [Gammaproteobacteria bacterium]
MPEYKENPRQLTLPLGNVIAFDYGTRSIGMAVGQTITGTASPLPPVAVEEQIPWHKIQRALREWQPIALVVGIPFNMDDTEQWSTEAARSFAKDLLACTQLSVFGVDERLTTQEARDILFEKRGYNALEKTAVDSLAATLILERFLQLP